MCARVCVCMGGEGHSANACQAYRVFEVRTWVGVGAGRRFDNAVRGPLHTLRCGLAAGASRMDIEPVCRVDDGPPTYSQPPNVTTPTTARQHVPTKVRHLPTRAATARGGGRASLPISTYKRYMCLLQRARGPVPFTHDAHLHTQQAADGSAAQAQQQQQQQQQQRHSAAGRHGAAGRRGTYLHAPPSAQDIITIYLS